MNKPVPTELLQELKEKYNVTVQSGGKVDAIIRGYVNGGNSQKKKMHIRTGWKHLKKALSGSKGQ